MCKDITQNLNKSYTPIAALIAYQSEKEDNSGYKEKSYYLETRKIKKDGTLGTAKPASMKFIIEMAKTFKDEHETHPHGTIPKNMLYADSRIGREKYIWWEKPKKRKLYFDKNLAIEDKEYSMPGVIYMVKGGDLYVYAFKGEKPTDKTKLLFGPFFNYYNDARICLGSAKVEWPDDITWENVQDHWQRMFWNSVNSHSMHNPMKEKFNMVIEIKASADNPFDTDKLAETRHTLKSLLVYG